jgi:hypothetical protein
MKRVLQLVFVTLSVLLLSACSMDDTTKNNGNNTVQQVTKSQNLISSIKKESNINTSFKTYISYQEEASALSDLSMIKKSADNLNNLIKDDSSSDEDEVKKLVTSINTLLTSKRVKNYLSSLDNYKNMKKNSPLYLNNIKTLISKVKQDNSNIASEKNTVIKQLEKLKSLYANKDGYFTTLGDSINSTQKELEAYLLIASDADINKDTDIEALISLKNIKDNADIVYNTYKNNINHVSKIKTELAEVYQKSVIGKRIVPIHYVYYIPTYKLDSYSNPSASSIKVSNYDYNKYKTAINFGNDIQYIGGYESLIVGFDAVNSYKLKFQTKKNGHITKTEEILVDEGLFEEMDSHMKNFNTNNLVIEYKAKGQFYDEMSTIPYPEEYGEAYSMIGNPAYGSWSGSGSNATWGFSDMIMAGVMGNMIGNSYGRRNSHYSRNSYSRNSRYYRSNGYGNHYDRYNDQNYNRNTGNYRTNSSTYKKVKTTNANNSLSNKVTKAAPKTPKGFSGNTGRVSSSNKSTKGVSYRSYAKAKKPTGNITSIGNATKNTGFRTPSSRMSNRATSKSGTKYKSKARAIKPPSPKKYDMSKRMSSNKKLQQRISNQTKKRIAKTKNSPKYKAAKKKRVAETKRKAAVKKKAVAAKRKKEKQRAAKARAKAKKKSSYKRKSSSKKR